LPYLVLQKKSSRYVLFALITAALGAIWIIFRGAPAALLTFDLGRGEKIFLIGIIALSVSL
jgi:hypothetical protein